MYRIVLTDYFLKHSKKLFRKYPHLKSDTIKSLNNFDSQFVIHLGNDLYKVRLKSSDLKKGKSKSFRLIVYLYRIENLITPIVIYFKGNRQDIELKEIKYRLKMVLNELEE